MNHTYTFIHWDKIVKATVSLKANNNEQAYNKLKNMFGEDINIHDHNFKYVSNATHFLAAGYGIKILVENYNTIKSPAHFNPSFFELINIST